LRYYGIKEVDKMFTRKNIQITSTQDEFLRRLNYETKLSESEHVRRALDHYLSAMYGGNYKKEASPMKNATVIFDNGGGITLQLGDWAHCYDDPYQAAVDYAEYIKTGNTEGWEGHEDFAAELDPEYDQIRNGGYRVYNAAEIEAELKNEDYTGWANIDEFCEALAKLRK
jgi:hypothetical protein